MMAGPENAAGTELPHWELARRLAGLYAARPETVAVGLGGSLAGGTADPSSDIDLYLFVTAPLPAGARRELARQAGAGYANLLLQFWDPGEQWFDAATGIEVDAMFWETAWVEAQVARVWEQFQPSLGYTTSFIHTLAGIRSLYDPQGWLAAVRDRCAAPYPEALRAAILRHNYPVLRGAIPAYRRQIDKAVRRGDRVSANHRTAALLASYFDLLFALNRRLHPGEKRLLELAGRLPSLPDGMAADVEAVLRLAGTAGPDLLPAVDRLVDRLEALLQSEGFALEDLVDYEPLGGGKP